mgnify:CR=1 FL=1|jgi:transcriptional regulator with XRE-family HTH domain
MIASDTKSYTRWGLKLAMMKRGKTQVWVAKEMGKDPQWVSRVVNGWIDPSVEDFARMASVLDLGIDEMEKLVSRVA